MRVRRVILVAVLVGMGSQGTLAANRGQAVYAQWCVACHGSGPGKPGTIALQAKYKGMRPAILEKRNDLTQEVVKVFVRRGVSVMPPFRKTEISDEELDALAAYLSKAAT